LGHIEQFLEHTAKSVLLYRFTFEVKRVPDQKFSDVIVVDLTKNYNIKNHVD